MSNLKNIQRKISEGVSGWLLFEFNCYRGYLFSEKYLTYPIAQILNCITEYSTLSEINHPSGNGGKGRPLQIDFILSDKQNFWKYAFESKWIGNTMISLGSVIWDLVRLQNLDAHYQGIKSYFVLAGFDKKINELIEDFEICHVPLSNKKNEITTVNSTFLIFDLFKLDPMAKAYLNKKKTKYPNLNLYSKIRCRPAHKFPKKDVINMTFSTYIFEILKPDPTQKVHAL